MLKSEPMDNEMEEDNEVEDLSMSRKQPAAIDAVIDQQTSFQPVQSPPLQQTGVIVQPLPKTANGEEAMERG